MIRAYTLVLLFTIASIFTLSHKTSWDIKKISPIQQVDARIINHDGSPSSEWIRFDPQITNLKNALKIQKRQLVEYRFDIIIPKKITSQVIRDHSILITQALNGIAVQKGTDLVELLPRSDSTTKFSWYRPLIITSEYYNISNGDNHIITAYSSTWDSNIFLSPIYYGAKKDIFWLNELIIFFSSHLSWATIIITLIYSMFFFAIWRTNKHDLIYKYTWISAASWFILCATNSIQSHAAETIPLIKSFIYAAISISTWSASNLAIAYINEEINNFYNKIILTACLAGPVLFYFDFISQFAMTSIWIYLVLACTLPFINTLLKRYVSKGASHTNPIILTSSVLGVAIAYRDVQYLSGFIDKSPAANNFTIIDALSIPVYIINIYGAFFFLISGFFIASKYSQISHSLSISSELMKEQLHEQAIEIKTLMLNRMQQEKKIAAQSERESISRDLHDGLGSKLTTMIYSCRRNEIKPAHLEQELAQMLEMLRELISRKDMVENSDFLTTAFEFCVEFEDLLSNYSLSFSYNIPEENNFSLMPETETHVLFIFQEIITNFIKHSSASHIHLEIIKEDDLTIAFKETEINPRETISNHTISQHKALTGGSGIKNIQFRAKEIDAVFHVDTSDKVRTSTLTINFMKDSSSSS